MRRRTLLLAAAAGIALPLLASWGGSGEPPPPALEAAPEAEPKAPAWDLLPPVPAAGNGLAAARRPERQTDPGIWATPAEFSEED